MAVYALTFSRPIGNPGVPATTDCSILLSGPTATDLPGPGAGWTVQHPSTAWLPEYASHRASRYFRSVAPVLANPARSSVAR